MPRELGICFSAALIPPIMAGLKRHGWDKNPWVVRYEFRRITR